MGCLLAVLGAFAPRLVLVILWIFTDYVSRAFDGWILPIIGFLLLPYTTLFYVFAYAPVRGVSGIGWFFVAMGFVIDVVNYTGGQRARSSRT